MNVLLIVLLVLLLVGAPPLWSYSAAWKALPSGALGFLPVFVVVLLLVGR